MNNAEISYYPTDDKYIWKVKITGYGFTHTGFVYLCEDGNFSEKIYTDFYDAKKRLAWYVVSLNEGKHVIH